jgi:UPF0176 protein
MSLPIVNISAYRFAEMQDLGALKDELHGLADARRLRGTILLSPEGINVFVAGERADIDALLAYLRSIPALADLNVKESFSREQPFNRMLVKIKREIIAFGVKGIDPRKYSSRRLPARQLKRWLDEGRPVTLLDTRNRFEVETGTFANAVAIGVDDFRDFPAAVARLPNHLKNQPIVTFCTGGIRCEKAAPYLEQNGFTDVCQLDGGILKYFEQCGGAHYNGHCFVFDKRVALDSALGESDLRQCFVCLAILSPEQQQLPEYVEGKSCPHCHRSPPEKYEKLIPVHQRSIAEAVSPLPGSVAYENIRPISVPLRCDGFELLDFLDAMHTHLSRPQWEEQCRHGRVECRGKKVSPGRIMRAGERLLHKMPAAVEPDVASDIRIIHEDDALLVIDKPAPLPMHPCGRFNRNSLSSILDQVFRPLKLRAAHRLDADTSGVVVFCKTREIARKVQMQFESGGVAKTYLARVQGHPTEIDFECHAPISAEPGPEGVRVPDDRGAAASTSFQLIEKYADGTSLLRVTPQTGRTNQIRVHLWHLNLPICGETMYLPEHQPGDGKSLSVSDPPLCLHAATIEFQHPLTLQPVRYEAPNSRAHAFGQ